MEQNTNHIPAVTDSQSDNESKVNTDEVNALTTVGRKDVIDIGGMLRNYLRYWWVFLLSLTICGGAAIFYLKKKSPVYLSVGLIMLNQQEDGGMSQAGGMTALISSLGFGSSSGANPENETFKMTAHSMMNNVVDTLHLYTSYWQDRGFFKRRLNYYHNEPVSVSLPAEVRDTLSMSTLFRLQGPVAGPWTLSYKQGKTKVKDITVNKLPYDVKTPYGTYRLDTTANFPASGELNVSAAFMTNADAIDWLNENIAVSYLTNKADAIQVDITDAVPERGETIVNTIMDLYNNGRDADRVAYNKSVLDFIDNRLLTLLHELESSESKIEQYKKTHKVVSAEAEAEYIFARKGAVEENAVTLQSGIQIMEMIQQMLTSPATKYSMIPFSGSGMQGMGDAYAKLIEGYNNLVMQRMTLASSAKEGNPTLVKMDEQIEATRQNILATVGRELQSARINYKTLQAEQSKSNARMTEIPSMEHELINLYRDREVQNTIYAFLLQKREETQIALSQSQPVGKIIDRAYTQTKPISPKPMLIYGAAFIFGVGIPAVFLQLRRRRK